jgi:hypothetical protein
MKDKFVLLRVTVEEFNLIDKVILKEYSIKFCDVQINKCKTLFKLLTKIRKTKQGIKDD